MVDLHMHSVFSDGSLTPEALVEAAAAIGLTAVALTDHDCMAGVERFCRAAAAAGIRGIPGVEISVDVRKGTMHMLGYHVDAQEPGLQGMLREIRDGREIRNEQILAKLNALGLALTWEEVKAYAGEDVVGRPHFAQAMLARKYVSEWSEAFDKYLGKGQAAYVERLRMTPRDSIRTIRGAGGIATLAHPFTLDLGPDELKACVAELAAEGLGGIEAYYSEHTNDQQRRYLALAREFDLAATGGSDFHGAINRDIRLGVGFGGLRVPDAAADDLERRHEVMKRVAAG